MHLDTFSRKILFLKIWNGNSNPQIVGNFFLRYHLESRTLPCYIRLDRGSETGLIATIQCYLQQKHGELDNPTDAVEYGPLHQTRLKNCGGIYMSK